ncbi:rhomboid family intramembrane serine protease [Streptomyces verrucosisporus]|uniref:rhomboid family intramembrane serine protease n=1 Tax=Streptomyces verrucosisporus TaxID=1695161 RepID=UPI0019D132CB|nr:rhomboid family intramembrane serine protease [Streptomyces verrucosisporus]MBN3929276.1 rhomboid family intramembrane serine protease [Streptomyces verrucosisporus]
MEEQQDGGRPAMPRCYRHPDRETGISCARCDRPICPECMIPASVGYQCPECVRGGSGAGRAAGDARPRTLAGGTVAADQRLVTKVLLGINVAVFFAVLAADDRSLLGALTMLGYAYDPAAADWVGVADGEWHRMLTSAFLHQEIWHIGFNMLALWWLGPQLEAALGRWRFLALYLLSALGGSALTYLLAAQNQESLGASGAIYGLFGATAVLVRRMRYDMRPILVLLAINLLITFRVPNIAWEAHIGGLVVGAVIAWAMVYAPRARRALVQYGTMAAVLLAITVVCVIRTVELLGR